MDGGRAGHRAQPPDPLSHTHTPTHPYSHTPPLPYPSTVTEAILDQKLVELLGDPDEGLPIRKDVRERLLRQKQAVAAGERGQELAEVARRLGLE